MSRRNPTLEETLAQVTQATELLRSVEGGFPEGLAGELGPESTPEAAAIEELLHIATHELSSTLGFILQDIRHLQMRGELRRKFAQFSVDRIESIVAQGWSMGLVRELHRELPDLPLKELSAEIRSLCDEWAALPKVHATRHGSEG